MIANIASGVVILVLGILLLSVRPPRRFAAGFGMFLALWGPVILTGNLAAYGLLFGDAAQARRLLLASAALLAVAYLPLAYVALTYPGTRRLDWQRPSFVVPLVTPAIIGGVIMVFEPTWMFAGIVPESGYLVSNWGPAYPFFFALFFGTMTVAALRIHEVTGTSRSGVAGKRAGAILAALTLYLGFEGGETLVLSASPFMDATAAFIDGSVATQGWTAGIYAATGAGVLAGLALLLLRDRLRDRHEGREPTPWLAGAVTLSVLLGLVAGTTQAVATIEPIVTLGLLRLGAVALLVYAILRYELFSLERPWAYRIGAAGLIAIAVLSGSVIVQGVALVTGSTLVAFAALQILILGGLAVLVHRWPSAIDGLRAFRATERSSPASEQRNLEIYEAALLQVREGGARSAEELEKLREHLGITANEHALLSRIVSDSVVGSAVGTLPTAGSRVADRYTVERVLGKGSRSQVVYAIDERTSQPVALKMLDPLEGDLGRAGRTLLREARVAARIDHPNIVAVHDVGLHEGRPFLVMEPVTGGTLADLLEDRAPLAPGETVNIMSAVLAGLAHLHGQGVLHRDIKPTNILLTESGEPKLADLGLATLWESDQTESLELAGRTRAGTLAFMAPEVILGQQATPASDLYSVGAILFELAHGKHYLGGQPRSYEELARAIVERPPDRPTGPTADVCERSLAKRPSERFQSAGELREALIEAVEESRQGQEEFAEEREAAADPEREVENVPRTDRAGI